MLPFVFFVLLLGANGLLDHLGRNYTHSAILSPNYYNLYWTIEEATSSILIGVECKTDGWVCLGWGAEDHSHLNADFMVAIYGDVTDYWSSKQETPRTDTALGSEDDLIRVNGSTTIKLPTSSNPYQIVRLMRKLDTGHSHDKPILLNQLNVVVWAYGTTQNIDKKHGDNSRDYALINFSTGEAILPVAGWNKGFQVVLALALIVILFVSVHFILPYRRLYFLHTYLRIPKVISFYLYDILFILLWAAVNVIWYIGWSSEGAELADKIGILIEPNILFLLFPVSRNSVWQFLLNIPFERALTYHRWVVMIMFVIVSIHGWMHIANWIQAGTVAGNLIEKVNLWGEISYGSFVLIVATAYWLIRRKGYELFFYFHFLFLSFFFFAFLHDTILIAYVVPGGLLYILDKFIRFYKGEIKQADLISATKIGKITRLEWKWADGSKFNFNPGQYLFLKVPSIDWFQRHPYSISSSPADNTVTMHIKDFGTWTHKLSELADTKNSFKIKIDGPYGAPPNIRGYDTVALFSTGAGAVPWISMVRDALKSNRQQPSLSTTIIDCFCQPFRSINVENAHITPQKVYFFWTVRSEEEIECFRDTLEEIRITGQMGKRFEFHIWITKANDDPTAVQSPSNEDGNEKVLIAESNQKNEGIHIAKNVRPTYEDLFQMLQQKHKDTDKRILCCTCGPAQMMWTIGKCCQQYSNQNLIFDFHKETFYF